MANTFDDLEMSHSVADEITCFLSAALWASAVIASNKHRYFNLLDILERNKRSLSNAFKPIRSILLKPAIAIVSIGVLPPVNLRLDSHRLAIVTSHVITSLIAKLAAYRTLVLDLVRTIHVIDSN